jgi:hypothetical protein
MPLASRCRPVHFARFDRTEIYWPIFSTGRVTTTPLVEDPPLQFRWRNLIGDSG